MQLLGPNQEKWLQAIESGDYPQGRQYLNKNNKFCCLGVACELFSVVVGSFSASENDLVTCYGNEEEDESCYCLAPADTTRTLALRDDAGRIDGKSEYNSLASMNDNNLDFPTIAKFIRENPEKVFTEPR